MNRTRGNASRWSGTVLTAFAALVLGGEFATAEPPAPPAELPEPITIQRNSPAYNASSATAYEEPVTPAAPAPNGCTGQAAGCGCGAEGCGADGSGCGCGNGFLCYKLGDPWTLSSLFGEKPPVTVGGWWQFGYQNNSDGIFNTYPHHFQLQQGWLYVERVADGSKGLDFGGRADIVYGTDAQNTQAFGNNPGRFDYLNGWDNGVYGWALPQLYGEVAYGNLSVKVGHFFTLLGYQVVPATGNFFYSIPFTFNFSEAFTHTGALATYKANDKVTMYGGYTFGWDTGFDRFNGGANFLGGSSVQVLDNLTATYITTFGDLGWIGSGYTHSFVADWNVTDKWEYVFQSDLVTTNFHPAFNSGYNTIGINQYLYYAVCDNIKLGGRIEWWKANGTSYYEGTLGMNYLPIANLRIRPEIRYQWAPGTNDANPLGIPVNQGIFAIDAILTY